MSARGKVELSCRFVGLVRLVVGFIWLYEGLWKKLVAADPHQQEIVASAGSIVGLPGEWVLGAIGAVETVLALVVVLGIAHRTVALLQGAALLAMNVCGILLGGGAIAAPADLLIHNVPLLLCIALVGLYGPGAWALKQPRGAECVADAIS